jgi:hypothetical protein
MLQGLRVTVTVVERRNAMRRRAQTMVLKMPLQESAAKQLTHLRMCWPS